MAIKTNRWHPDTCGCVLDYEWDDSVPDTARVHTGVRAVPCPEHAHLGSAHAIYAAVVIHNREKGKKNQ